MLLVSVSAYVRKRPMILGVSNVLVSSVPLITSLQCRAARVLLGMSAPELAKKAGVGIATIKRFESGQPVQPATVEAVVAALTTAGIAFIADGGRSLEGGEGVRLRPIRPDEI